MHNDCSAGGANKPKIGDGGNQSIVAGEGGSTTVKIDYKKVFFNENPALKGTVVVHHSIEQQVLEKYPGLFSAEEVNSNKYVRGIPNDVNSEIHLSAIHKSWNEFYKGVNSGEIAATKGNFLIKANEIDGLYESQFMPPI